MSDLKTREPGPWTLDESAAGNGHVEAGYLSFVPFFFFSNSKSGQNCIRSLAPCIRKNLRRQNKNNVDLSLYTRLSSIHSRHFLHLPTTGSSLVGKLHRQHVIRL